MTQKEIIAYYEDNGGLRCKDWSTKEIKEHIKCELGSNQKVTIRTCLMLKRSAEINQR